MVKPDCGMLPLSRIAAAEFAAASGESLRPRGSLP
jgi:hypothetical protein